MYNCAPPPIRWPDDARICMSITVGFEAFLYAGHMSFGRAKPGEKHAFSLSFADYAYKVGIWRILDLLDRHKVKATFDVGGLAADRYPNAVRAMAQAGHEVAGHGWANDVVPQENDLEGELKGIKDTLAAIEAACGARPRGWVSPGSMSTSMTRQRLMEEGLAWDGDDISQDLPFVVRQQSKSIVVLPRVNLPCNDLVTCVIFGNPPGAYLEGFVETFDFLYKEGLRGRPGWVDIIIHADLGARPYLMSVIEKAIAYAKGFDGVWFARREDIAAWTLAQHDQAAAKADA